jgi:hypothetical protein
MVSTADPYGRNLGSLGRIMGIPFFVKKSRVTGIALLSFLLYIVNIRLLRCMHN